MKGLKNYKLIAIIIIIMFIILEMFLFQEITNLISDINKLSNINNNYSGVITFFFINLILVIFLFAISLKILSLKLNKDVTKTEDYSKKETREEINDDLEEKNKTEKEVETEKELNSIFEELRKIKDINLYTEKFLINVAKKYEIVQGLFYLKISKSEEFEVCSKYAYFNEEEPKKIKIGEGLSGQVAKDKKAMNLSEVPENYIKVVSGTGESSPKYLLILPVINKEKTIGIVELASFVPFKENFVKQSVVLFEKNSEFISQLIKK
ncbi:MAG: GAF domain-containing protein [Bacteroidales bacterium]|nr:GAF domain-containing protein [Bacteroidales bacterium]